MEKNHSSSKFDRISDLPWNVVDNILVRLPLRTAVRTSILSKSWRYKWVTLSKLEFLCFDFYDPKSEDEANASKKMTNIIYGILLRHHDQIDKFKIFSYGAVDSYDLDQWLLFLSTKNIKELNLSYSIHFHNSYKLHSCLFSCQQLDRLELSHCILELPLTFKGFNNLRSLVLKYTSTRDEELGSLIQSCPVLEEVNLFSIQGLSTLKIHAPKLKSLKLSCFFDDISIESCPVLELISIRWSSNNARAKQLKHPRMVRNLVRVLGGLSRLKHLEILGRFIEYFAVGEVPEKLPISCNHLKCLNLSFVSNNLEEIRVAFSFLRSLSLKELQFWVTKGTGSNKMKVQAMLKFMTAQRQSNISFTQLRLAMISFTGARPEIEFVKLVLARSPVLETVVIYINGRRANKKIMEELQQAAWASARAKEKYFSPKP